mmetsp:Transcript_34998/g.99190  ORF Transcript_34998/g.99190 Transcript_34998/m.99190 type:complete len:176 (-) Transcript_34998:333-860(-)|eukprot:CAMPEP_0117664410 /NCGR_PEP_ID=MMETSP0804-20121206/9205_1 /TAXON_ID=1074897 /ORGANISM="Tetraselmis astigmatica, Strain CCMP880" /LENGTH=175 /DNA_ID=CAMNT_0005471641 /DNA_START=323 /DNA_END=850 /DNA_ORIENTATION=-
MTTACFGTRALLSKVSSARPSVWSCNPAATRGHAGSSWRSNSDEFGSGGSLGYCGTLDDLLDLGGYGSEGEGGVADMSLDFYESAAVPLGGVDLTEDDSCFCAVENLAAAAAEEEQTRPSFQQHMDVGHVYSPKGARYFSSVWSNPRQRVRKVRDGLAHVRDWLRPHTSDRTFAT